MTCCDEIKRFLWFFSSHAICMFMIPYLRTFIKMTFSPDFPCAPFGIFSGAEKESHNSGSQGVHVRFFCFWRIVSISIFSRDRATFPLSSSSFCWSSLTSFLSLTFVALQRRLCVSGIRLTRWRKVSRSFWNAVTDFRGILRFCSSFWNDFRKPSVCLVSRIFRTVRFERWWVWMDFAMKLSSKWNGYVEGFRHGVLYNIFI